MAKKNVEAAAAAKAKKQKMILIVGGVLLLGLGVIQGPKLLGGGGGSEAAPVAATPTGAETGTPAPTATSPAPVAAAAFKPAGTVAGVALPGATVVRVSTAQLGSFTLFEVKDPFVQQASEGSATDGTSSATKPTAAASPEPKASGSSSGSPAPAPAPPLVYATINLDGKPQQVKVKQEFPKNEPLFVLVSVGKSKAKISVAGGSFDSGETIALTLGKKLTLVNTATNVRYVLKLVYTGSEPETIQGFAADDPSSAGTDPSSSSTVSVAPAATP